MLRPLLKWAGGSALGGAALLAFANLTQGQSGLPVVPRPIMPELPGAVQTVAKETAPAAPAPPPPPSVGPAQPNSSADDLKARIDRLEKQNQELMETLKAMKVQQQQPVATATTSTEAAKVNPTLSPQDVRQMIGSYLADKEAEKKAQARLDQETGIKVGSNWSIMGDITDGFLLLYTPNKDFTMHIGGWFQYDNVEWHESQALYQPQGGRAGPAQKVASGANLGGIGNVSNITQPGGAPLQDGTYWRRIRPFVEGTFWENGEYRLNLALENNQFSTAGLDEFWGAWNKIPLIGTVRFGHVKNALGLEPDMTSSSRIMTFMERSSYSEAIEMNQNFVSGLWFHNAFLNDRVTYTTTLFRSDIGSSTGTYFGDGQGYGAQGRLTALPLYEADGRHLLHLGLSGGWRLGTANLNGANGAAATNVNTFTLSARPELREDDPAASPAGGQVIPNANSNRMISTGALAAANDYVVGTELLYIRGPFSVQSEWGANRLQDVTGVAPGAANVLAVPFKNRQDYTFWGGYVQLAYTLTGENRAYDKWLGTLDRYYLTKRGPYNRFWLTRDENGRVTWNTGAWEVAARYSYTNLNDGTNVGPNLYRIQGGQMDGIALALNWYINSNLTVNFDWIYDHRYNLPTGASAINPLTSSLPGYTSGFGIRMQMSF